MKWRIFELRAYQIIGVERELVKLLFPIPKQERDLVNGF
jgi:hypothetical protein